MEVIVMKIYVGNLSFDASEKDLQDAFGAFGTVSAANIIKDKFSGRSRGFGFVEMPTEAEARTAIAEINGKELKGRAVKVNEAMDRPDNRRSDGGGGGRDRGGRSYGGGGGGGGNRGGRGGRGDY
jgi:RNA recognition motif-containing protein